MYNLEISEMGNGVFRVSRVEDVVTVDVKVAKDLLISGHRYLDVR